ncbi:aspartic peptidase domain-containing protein [Mycena maculata]|uniref:Aspartic peptidase domain-containing protein n=1 Tax=Mycena maculata TaxID=230809 RepID=A0AAD7MFE5_9AGAR|nr:aspartic peptidase domain-containing protein [Mycena maculata]
MALAFILPTILLSLRVVAGPGDIDDTVISLPIARRFNFEGTATIVEKDLARIQAIQSRTPGIASREVISEPVNNQVVSYIASVGVGSPATAYDLIVDTGSSNTWVGASQAYVKTSTSVNTGQSVAVTYGSGSFSGTEYTDTVTLAPGLVINEQSIGVASTSSGFNSGVDGILGIGPVDLTAGTVSNTPTVPTVTDSLFSQGTISADIIGISFQPAITSNDTGGSIAFGGPDTTKISAPINYTPVTAIPPSSSYWGIEQTISYGNTSISLPVSGIVDTGTTLIYFGPVTFGLYQLLTGATLDNTTGLLTITTSQYANLQPLNFHIGGTIYALSPNAQIFPRALNTEIGGVASSIYLIVANLGTTVVGGPAFINGYAFLERFYSVYDTANKRVGFATTPYTDAVTN